MTKHNGSRPRQLRLPFNVPIKGDVCQSCDSVMREVCNVCAQCKTCGHATRSCEGKFIPVEE